MTAKALPQLRKASLGRVDLSKEREWLIRHGSEYIGQWVVLAEGCLVGHTNKSDELLSIVAKARSAGNQIPYVKYIADESSPDWMGWI